MDCGVRTFSLVHPILQQCGMACHAESSRAMFWSPDCKCSTLNCCFKFHVVYLPPKITGFKFQTPKNNSIFGSKNLCHLVLQLRSVVSYQYKTETQFSKYKQKSMWRSLSRKQFCSLFFSANQKKIMQISS